MIHIFAVNPPLSLNDLILTALVALVIGCALANWGWWSQNAAPTLPKKWAVSARPVLGTRERRLHHRLRSAFPPHLILPKLALVRFCQPDDALKVRYWYGLLGSSHVAFAVCNSEGIVVLAIDLNGDRPRSRRGLQVRQCVLAACGVKHLRVDPRQLPEVSELQSVLPSGAIANAAQAFPEPHPSPPLDAAWATLATTVAARRAQRKPQWQESSLFQDSFFSADGLTGSAAELISRPAPHGTPAQTAASRPPEEFKVDRCDLPLTMGG